jgi:hypothetical protein
VHGDGAEPVIAALGGDVEAIRYFDEKYRLEQNAKLKFWTTVSKMYYRDLDGYVQSFNSRFAIVTIRGSACVARSRDNEGNLLKSPIFYTFENFKKEHQHLQARVPVLDDAGLPVFYERGEKAGQVKMKLSTVAAEWLKHREALRFPIGVDCEPEPARLAPGIYNLWHGFGVQRRPGEWGTIKDHLLQHICRGNEAHADWLVKWFARAVQFPGSRAETMVILRGPEGEGKGWVAAVTKRIFERHHTVAMSRDDLFGRFNDHLLNAVFLHVDEGYTTGRAEDDAKLKGLVTEEAIQIEIKFVSKFMAKNRLKILMTTNSTWAIPAGPNARRYFVLDVPEGRAGDKEYFKKVWAALEDGGEIECFLDYLLGLDLSDFDHRRPPMTKGLQTQMELSLNSFEAFWFGCLEEGRLCGLQLPATVGKNALHSAYREHAEADGVPAHKLVKSNGVKPVLEKLVPDLGEVDKGSAVQDRRQWSLPSLAVCRAAWEKKYGARDWGVLPDFPHKENECGSSDTAEILDFPRPPTLPTPFEKSREEGSC